MKNNRDGCKLLSLGIACGLALSPLAYQPAAWTHSQVYEQNVFSFNTHPDMPLKLYAAGRIGTVSAGYARSYLVVAYRYLTGKPLTAGEQGEFLALWHRRLHLPLCVQPDDELNAWLKDRSKYVVAKEKNAPYEDVVRVTKKPAEIIYLNCQDEAFRTARATLAKRVAKYGAASAYIKEWLKGQDGVFCHCGGPQYDYKADKPRPEPAFPPPLPDSAARELRQDRDYQIAAAHFYGEQFDAALSLFGKVAGDASSPWQTTAKYMIVRTLIRQSALSKQSDFAPEPLKKAITLIKELQADPRYAEFRASLKSLLDYAQIRLDPLGSLDRLSKELSRPGDGKDLREKLNDFTILLTNYMGDFDMDPKEKDQDIDPKAAKVIRANELTDWIYTYTSDLGPDKQHAIERFKSTHSLLWAIALASHLKKKDVLDDEIIAVLSRVTKNDPAYILASYVKASLLKDQGKVKECLAVLDDALASSANTPSSANDFSELKLPLVTSFDQFMQCSFRPPAVILEAGDYSELPERMDTIEKTSQFPKNQMVLEPQSAVAFNKQLPLKRLFAASLSRLLPGRYKFDFAQAIFVRAVMLGDYGTAGKVIPTLESSNPSLSKGLSAFAAATTPDGHDFAATCLMLQNPGMRPTVTGGGKRAIPFNKIDEWRDNWWIPESFGRSEYSVDEIPEDSLLPLAFLSAADRADAKKEMSRLEAQGDGLKYMAKVVLDLN